MLDELLKEYVALQAEEEKLASKKSELKNLIIEEMGDRTKYVSADNVQATLVDKQTYKYLDEVAIISYLKKNKLERFVNEKVNAVALNKELKKKSSLCESLKPFYQETVSTSLLVK